MPKRSSLFARTWFCDRDAVLAQARALVRGFMAQHPQVVALWVFGSYAWGTPTPRSDLDVVVETAQSLSRQARWELAEALRAVLLPLPCPVDVVVLSSRELTAPFAVAAAVKARGLRLA